MPDVGLRSVSRATTKHGGRIAGHSKQGKGSTVAIILPLTLISDSQEALTGNISI